MTKAWVKTSGTSTTKGASVLFFGFHWSFTIMEPSGKGWPLPGTPALYALIIVGLATITLSTSSVRAEETTAQSSYPLKSENAIPLGDFSEYLSGPFFCRKCRQLASRQRLSVTASVYQDLANCCDFHFDVLSLSFQSLPCALWAGGAHVVRAATPL